MKVLNWVTLGIAVVALVLGIMFFRTSDEVRGLTNEVYDGRGAYGWSAYGGGSRIDALEDEVYGGAFMRTSFDGSRIDTLEDDLEEVHSYIEELYWYIR